MKMGGGRVEINSQLNPSFPLKKKVASKTQPY